MGRQIITISMQEEDKALLMKLSDESAMNPSEIMQQLIRKAAKDPVEMEIIMQNFIKENGEKCGKKRLLRIMSIRSMKKKLAAQRASGERCNASSTYENTMDEIEKQWWKEFCAEQLENGHYYKITYEDFQLWKAVNAARLGMEALKDAGL